MRRMLCSQKKTNCSKQALICNIYLYLSYFFFCVFFHCPFRPSHQSLLSNILLYRCSFFHKSRSTFFFLVLPLFFLYILCDHDFYFALIFFFFIGLVHRAIKSLGQTDKTILLYAVCVISVPSCHHLRHVLEKSMEAAL